MRRSLTCGLMQVLVLNGPNLNMLGEREPEVYGSTTLTDIKQQLTGIAADLGVTIRFEQRNGEGELVDLVQQARSGDGLILNPGAYGHYSYALRDAVSAADIPCIEVHISNVYARETFRHTSVIAPVTAGYICGCGVFGYELALRAVVHRIQERHR
jgi:3-dehydroquinate dehydratase II